MLIIMKTECIKMFRTMYLCGTNNHNEHLRPNNMDFGDSFVEINNYFDRVDGCDSFCTKYRYVRIFPWIGLIDAIRCVYV